MNKTFWFSDTAFHVVRVAACLCVLFGGLSGLIALCMACCCQGSKTIGVGITCFVAGRAPISSKTSLL